MTELAHLICRYIAAQLELLPTWDKAYAVCFKNAGGDENKAQIQRYAYLDLPKPSPLIVTPSDNRGTYIYIRELGDNIEGRGFFDDSGSCRQSGVEVEKRFRAVAVSDTLKMSTSLASKLAFDVMRTNTEDNQIKAQIGYKVYDVEIAWQGEHNGLNTLFEEETGATPKSHNLQIAAFDFELRFKYIPVCTEDEINVC